MTINEQIGMPLVKKGETLYQPSLYGGAIDEITSLITEKPVVVGTVYYQNANGNDSWTGMAGWSSCSGCSSANGYSNVTAGEKAMFELCIAKCKTLYINKDKENECIEKCKQKHGVKSVSDYVTAGMSTGNAEAISNTLPTIFGGKKPMQTEEDKKRIIDNLNEQNSGGSITGSLSSNAKLGLVVGAVAIVGVIAFMAFRRKK